MRFGPDYPDSLRAFLAEQVPTEANRRQKVEAILAALLDDGLKLDYSLFETLTELVSGLIASALVATG